MGQIREQSDKVLGPKVQETRVWLDFDGNEREKLTV